MLGDGGNLMPLIYRLTGRAKVAKATKGNTFFANFAVFARNAFPALISHSALRTLHSALERLFS